MYKSYRARITGNRIEWLDETPPEVLAGKPVKVLVTVLDTMPPNSASVESTDSDDLNQSID